MKDNDSEIRIEDNSPDDEELLNRRDFLVGLKKWSKIVIGGALLSGALSVPKASAGAWINRWGGGGAWGNGGGHWHNHGGSWGNGGGGSWANRHGGGGWVNRRY